MKILKNNIVLIIATLIVAAGLYWYFFAGRGTQQPLTATTVLTPQQTQFQILADELSPISFNTSIFSDPRFTGLQDITTTVSPESIGRSDPFKPL